MTESRETRVLSRLYLWLGTSQALVALFCATAAFVSASGPASVLAILATVFFTVAATAGLLSGVGLIVAGIGRAREVQPNRA